MKSTIFILFCVLIISGCGQEETRPDCSAVSCMANLWSVKLKYVDKATNKPLLGTGSVYSANDLQVTQTKASTYSSKVTVDNSDETVLILNPVLGTEILTLGSLLADKITMQTKVRGKECCAKVDVVSLKINDVTICAPCDDLSNTIAVIKK